MSHCQTHPYCLDCLRATEPAAFRPVDLAVDMNNPRDIYWWYDGPRCFTVACGDRLLFLCQTDEVDTKWQYAGRPVTPDGLAELESGAVGVREFLHASPNVYVVHWNVKTDVVETFLATLDCFGDDCWPDPDVKLLPRDPR